HDGRTVLFQTAAARIHDETNADITADNAGGTDEDIFLRRPKLAAPADFYPNGALTDTVLEVVDVSNSGSAVRTTMCQEDDVAGNQKGVAAFLRPEAPTGSAPVAGPCRSGDLNGNGSTSDQIVYLVGDGQNPVSLDKAATAIAISNAYVAAV